MAALIEAEVRSNFEIFQKLVHGWLDMHRGEYALLRAGKLVDFFDLPGDAIESASEQFSDGLFSIQRVTDRPVDLGFLSYGSGDWSTDER